MSSNSAAKKAAFGVLGLAAAVCAGTAALCFGLATSVLDERAEAHAIDFAQAAGAGLAQRLSATHGALDRIAATVSTGDRAASGATAAATPYFTSVAWSADAGASVQLHGAPKPAPMRSADLRKVPQHPTLLLDAAGSAAELVVARRVAAGHPGVLVAHIDGDYLSQRAQPRVRDICVVYEFDVLFCSGAALPESVRRQLYANRAAAKGVVRWQSDSETRSAGFARVALDPAMGSGNLMVVAAQSADEARAGVNALVWRFVPAFAAALAFALLAAWGVLRLARRGPHVAAVGGTRLEALHEPIAGSSDAQPAFGDERERLAMRVLADIDRAILSRAHLDGVIALVLDAAPQAIGCRLAAVTVVDPGQKDQARTTLAAGAAGEDRTVHCAPLDPASTQAFARDPDGCMLDPPAVPRFLQPLIERGAARLLVLPVYVDASLAALLALGLPEGFEPDATARALARDFADRLGVALTAAVREHDVQRHANYDPVTSLPNQRLLRERLAQEIARAQRESGELALMYVDLDQFRKVNDSVGHLEGDTLLEQAARRMKRCLRAEDVIARFSGDEFVILLPALAKGANASRVAEKLIAALAQPFVVAGVEHHLGASIGISVFPQDGRTADKLLRNANFAVYRAKAAGRGQCVFFDEHMNAQALQRATLERDIRAAITNGELHLAYQPQIDLRDGRIIGAEALARWNHPRLGPIPPSVFIEIVEQSSLIEAVGKFVREAACAQYQAWVARGLSLPRIAINVSGHEIQRSGYVDQIRALLQSHSMRPFSLELEITENLLLEASQNVLATLQSLRELGVHLAIDDFGTGYSSLAYLKNLPFDVLKIDRSFVKDLGSGDGSEGVVNAILGVARSLGKDVIAEGVETEAQRVYLVDAGCEGGQGYVWSQPLSPDQFEKLARDWLATPQRRVPQSVQPQVLAA